MKREVIRRLIEEGVLLIAPLRPRGAGDLPRIRAALSA